ncbi:uroporphyrinogen-III synthase, partial [Ottowia sp.]|uniref:uroporphyrinogen-III synthase n=1 Tax=Ottowia sp. TaxID=1898956 RepID=UPI003A85C1E5
MSARLIVTRPAREAARWVDELKTQGLDAVALPLIDIVPEPPGVAQQAARVQCEGGGYHAVMFVSAQAVRGFLGPYFSEKNQPLTQDRKALKAIESRAWVTGPGTAAAVLAAGWPPDLLDAPPADAVQFDSEALWQRIAPQLVSAPTRNLRVLIVRGGDAQGRLAGRHWLAEQLQAAGVAVDQAVAYRRAAPVLTGMQRTLAQAAAQDGSWWLFSSSEAVANLQKALPAQPWQAARALATHPRIAQALRAAGFGVVQGTRP